MTTLQDIRPMFFRVWDEHQIIERFRWLKRSRRRFVNYGLNGSIYVTTRKEDLAAVRRELEHRGLRS